MSDARWKPVREDDSGGERRLERRRELAQSLARGGMENVQVLSFEQAETVLTPKRREIIETLRTEDDITSVRGLARTLDRDKAQVSRDLKTLAEHSVISYEETGRGKRPYLQQEHLVVEPL